MAVANMDPKAYAEAMAQAQAGVGKLTAVQLRALLTELRALRREVAAELATVAPEDGSWNAFHLRRLNKAMGAAIDGFGVRYADLLTRGKRVAVRAGAEAMPSAMVAAGADTLPLIRLGPLEAAALRGQQSLIKNLTDTARRQVAKRLRAGVAGAKSPHDIGQSIMRYLDTPRRPTSRFGGLAYQAARIVVTELGQTFELANRASQDHVVKTVGGTGWRIIWLHSGQSPPRGRRAHVALHGTSIAQDTEERFNVNGYDAIGPHDPDLPAGEVIYCRCTSSQWREDWGEFTPAFPPGSDAERGKSPEHNAQAEKLGIPVPRAPEGA